MLLLLAAACASSDTTREGAVNGGFDPPPFDALVKRICPTFIDDTQPSASRVLSPERARGVAQPSNVLCLRARVGQKATCSTNGSTTEFATVGTTIVGCGDTSTVYAVEVVP